MAHDVVMPMLGMVQDTGTIVSWHKQIGDAVKASDVLMEVETDKATVEIEAGFDGFVTALKAETGVPVPVGDVVAVISDDKSDIGAAPPAPAEAEAAPSESAAPESARAEPKPEKPAVPAVTPVPAPTAAPAPPPRPQPRPSGGRVLASPKARRLAEERGVDLGRLVRLGVPEPIHVADLDKVGAAQTAALPTSMMRVTVERAPFNTFLDWAEEDAGVVVDALNLWAAFAAGSLRAATGREPGEEILVEASRFPSPADAVALRSPDRAGLAGLRTQPAGDAAALTLLDLSQTILSEYRPAGDRPLPYLTICNGQDSANFDLYLEFDPASLPAETAYAFLKELADRTQVPLRHLL